MTDYYPVIARCVADLEENIAVRHEFYWLARAELAGELCGLNSSLTPAGKMGERLGLDGAIRTVEAGVLSFDQAQGLGSGQTEPPRPQAAAGRQSITPR